MKILFLQKRLLFPTNDGGKVRTLNVVRHLARWHEVTYLSNILPEKEPYVGAMEELGVRMVTIPWKETSRGTLRFYGDLARNVFSPYPFTVAKDYDPRLRRRVGIPDRFVNRISSADGRGPIVVFRVNEAQGDS